MKLCVIGAGAAGLISIKHGIDFGCDVTAFELTKSIGGLWNFTDQTEKDKFGVDIHSSMYDGLMTNLPIEVMSYPGEPFPKQKKSFVSSNEVLEYYETFASKYDLKKFIKFRHQVIRVRPIAKKWEIIVKNLPNDSYETYLFDAVLACSGVLHSGFIPSYDGQEDFKGKQIHSRSYRRAANFKGEKLLVIGGSFSGGDVVLETMKFASKVYWSHHLQTKPDKKYFNENVEQLPDVKRFTSNEVEFVDGSFREVTTVVYCTGYEYKFPYLSVDCGISSEDNILKPLYMHCININNPTLAFIGIPQVICPNQIFDLQARFFLTFFTGRKEFPSKDQMIKENESEMKLREKQDKKKFHRLKDELQQKYYNDLARAANIEPIMSVMAKIHAQCYINRRSEFVNFRNVKFHIVDAENFTMSRIDE